MKILDQIDDGVIRLIDDNDVGIDVLFVGDFCPGKKCEELCRHQEYDKIYNDSISILQNKTISVLNLESPLTCKKYPIIKEGPHLSADPSCAEALKYGNFDIAALANNHILDHGSEGLQDTIDLCRKAGIKTVGAGVNQTEAQKPLIIAVNSVKIGFLNFTENEFSIAKGDNVGACGLDPVSNYHQIMKLKNEVDYIIVVIHGGNELFPLPNPRMVEVYRFFAGLGVTAIIGHHSHCASGFEVYEGVPIFYSLGNFIFESVEEMKDIWYNGYMVKLSLSRNSVSMISLYPYEQFKSGLGVRILQGEEYISFLKKIKRYSEIIQDSHLLLENWEKFCSENESLYLSTLLGLNRVERALFRRGVGKNYFMKKNVLIRLLNQIRCEAHREASMQILQSNIKRKI